jgi:hypothetical protein
MQLRATVSAAAGTSLSRNPATKDASSLVKGAGAAASGSEALMNSLPN